MNAPPETAELLRSDVEFVLSRRQVNGDPSFLWLSAVSNLVMPTGAQRLEHEFSLRDLLDPSWAIRPLAVIKDQGRPTLKLEDPGGRLLSELVGRPWDPADFLRVAISMTGALRKAHEQGLVHKDVKPANVMTQAATGQSWLTGFGIASRLRRERRAPDPPQIIAGSLEYMAPEQTGRMNRSVDSRSDLYSLGITFYEMLTGELPFAASDPMGWVHCHIARAAPRADERHKSVPDQLGALVAKLLEKPAESRYQTAAGLEADLRRCLRALDGSGVIDPFALGSADIPDQLLVPERLYGRDSEIEALIATFDIVVADGSLGVVLVSGYPGIGKSSVVNELHKSLVPPRGLFASGKFDQYKRDIPYATLAQALQHLARMILVESDAELERWRTAIARAVGPNAMLIANLIPELELLIGPSAPVPDLPPVETQNRFQLVFRDFIAVFARPEHPLALFLDDLQWVDAATLHMLERLVATPEGLHLLVVGAYRSNEVHPAHPLTPALEAIRASRVRLRELVLEPLKASHVEELVADALHGKPTDALPLARLVYEKAGGNPFFTIEFLAELAHERLLAFDPNAQTWRWDTALIDAKGYTSNVIDLMVAKLTRFGPFTQGVLKDMACLGNRVESVTLARVRGSSVAAVDENLWDAVQTGVVIRTGSGYVFVHDRVHEAAYSLIPNALRPEAHLHIGRLLLSNLAADATAEVVFGVVSQLALAIDLIQDEHERATIRRLNIRAGKMAKGSIAYANACSHFALAVDLSPPDAWACDYADTFELHLLLSECEFMVGHFGAAEAHFEMILTRARSRVDKAAVYRVRLQLYQVAGRYSEGIGLARDALRLFDIDIPDSSDDIRCATRAACDAVWSNLGERDIASLVDALACSDAELRALMEILVNAGPCAFNGRPELYPLITVTGVNLSLRNGPTRLSSFSYGAYAVVLVSVFRDTPRGVAFSELSLRLNDRFDNAQLIGSLLLVHAAYVLFWKQHFAKTLSPLKRAYAACLETGDLSYAGFTAFLYVWHCVESGAALDEVERHAIDFAAFAKQSKNEAVHQVIRMQQQFVASLQGKTDDPLRMDDRSFDEAASLAAVVDATFGCGAAHYYVMKQILAFLQGRHDEATAAAMSAEPYLGSAMSMAIEAAHFFFYALSAAALAGEGPATVDRQKHVRILSEAAQRFALWAEHCPENFGGRHSLLAAEVARVEGRAFDAMRLYEAAIQAARKDGFVQHEAMACEMAAQFYEAHGFETAARAHFRVALETYSRWGAGSKVVQLEKRHARLLEAHATGRTAAALGTYVEQLDLATVGRVLQALTGEMLLEKWVGTFMALAMEDAGAQRGVLLVAQGDSLHCLAEATTALGGVEVRVSPATGEDLATPRSVLRYVMRTQDSVLLDDAAASSAFSRDDYISSRRCRSILCLPLEKQKVVTGVLYLENNLAPCVFTPRRAAVLKLVASQAAISLENARLHTDLQQENTARKSSEEALRHSQAYLAEAQRLSRTGSFGWDVATGTLVFSDETYRIIGLDPTSKPMLDDVIARMHPDDISFVRETLAHAAHSGGRLDYEHRFRMEDDSITFVHVLARPVTNASGLVEYVGAIQDITEQRRAELALHHAQEDLARVARASALGELAASIAHEVNQPLGAVSANANAALNWLAFSPPMFADAREALAAIVSDSERASEVISRIRGLFSRTAFARARCDVNAMVLEVFRIVRSQLERQRVVLEVDLAVDLPGILGDPIQLQQVLLNLLLNAVDACGDLGAERRRVLVRTAAELEDGAPWVVVQVRDAGSGIDPSARSRLFEAFHTTKPGGLGIGLSISRSIVEHHGGQLTATPNELHGATFAFRLPALQ